MTRKRPRALLCIPTYVLGQPALFSDLSEEGAQLDFAENPPDCALGISVQIPLVLAPQLPAFWLEAKLARKADQKWGLEFRELPARIRHVIARLVEFHRS